MAAATLRDYRDADQAQVDAMATIRGLPHGSGCALTNIYK
jgi:hypothetical protein